ncbi:MAG: ABC transporter substrate-binding protein [Firmicutes bacterium]|nr:ABC transporter substrate-binding protein [Bacillota bacterium]
MKKILALFLACFMMMALAACKGEAASSGTSETAVSQAAGSGSAAGGSVYYLNFKPEQADDWVRLAGQYTERTGVPVTVVTAASGTYESTLKSEIAKTEAPTLFQVNGPVGLASWKEYCYDLSGSEIFKQLTSEDFALKDGEKVDGIAYVIETYGLIYNKTLMNRYCGLDNAKIQDVSELNSFAKLKEVADDMQKRRDELGIRGAFTSAGMDSSSDWRFKTHLANLPVYYEYQDEGISDTDAIKGTYLENYKNVWDLYLTDSTCDPKLISSKTGDDALSEFVMGEAVFYQNGTWAYTDIQRDGSLSDDEIGILPLYIGAPGEEKQGLCTGSENYWCVNKNASAADIQATLDFMNWCISSDEGRSALCNEMGFVCPFKTFTDEYLPKNPLIAAANDYLADGKTPVAWCFPTMPSDTWKNNVGGALLKYAQGTGSWEDVQKAFVDGWKTEKEAAKSAQ